MEKIVETKTCKHCSIKFHITDKDLKFYKKVSPKINGETFQIPTPAFCPDCRSQRRILWRNERNLYKRKCDATGEDIISIYSSNKPYKVYSQDFWWSDKWDPMKYGKSVDLNTTFIEQFKYLSEDVPHISRMVVNCQNSDYVNGASGLKSCYLCFNSDILENSFYSSTSNNSKNIFDSYMLIDCEKCYECVNCNKSYGLYYSTNSISCSNSYLLENCVGCINCFGCVNLTNKQYCIFNKQYTKEEYNTLLNKKLKEIKTYIYNFSSFKKQYPKKNYFGENNEIFSGDYIYNIKNSHNCFNSRNIEDCKYCWYTYDSKNCYDLDIFGDKSEYIYESVMTGGEVYNILFGIGNWGKCQNLMYCLLCVGTSNCFGCIGLKNKSYCILNKQYTKEEYNKLVPRIIKKMIKNGEWGEFFPSSISPFGYNETIASEYFSLSKKDALKQQFNWSDYEAPKPNVEKIIQADKLPENIHDIPDDIINWAIECEVTKKPFRIIPQELAFYRKHNLPVPKRHPDQRHLDRMKLRNPRKLFNRNCDKCGVKMKTTYSSDREETVYCEECYNKETY